MRTGSSPLDIEKRNKLKECVVCVGAESSRHKKKGCGIRQSKELYVVKTSEEEDDSEETEIKYLKNHAAKIHFISNDGGIRAIPVRDRLHQLVTGTNVHPAAENTANPLR